jgi:hypothetical protein
MRDSRVVLLMRGPALTLFPPAELEVTLDNKRGVGDADVAAVWQFSFGQGLFVHYSVSFHVFTYRYAVCCCIDASLRAVTERSSSTDSR